MLSDDLNEYTDNLIETINNYTVDLMINAGVILPSSPSPETVFAAMLDMDRRGYELSLYQKTGLQYNELFHSAILLNRYGKFVKGYQIMGIMNHDDIGVLSLDISVEEVGDVVDD